MQPSETPSVSVDTTTEKGEKKGGKEESHGKKKEKDRSKGKEHEVSETKSVTKGVEDTDAAKDDELDNKGQWTSTLLLSVGAALSGSFQFGYHFGCMNVPHLVMRKFFLESHSNLTGVAVDFDHIDIYQWALAVSIFAVGGMLGSLPASWMANLWGRRVAMYISSGIAVIAGSLLTTAYYVHIYHLITVGRFLIGISAGMSSELVPMYLSEISPKALRTTIGNLHQLVVAFAILFSQFIGLPIILGRPQLWPIIFAFTALPVIWQAASLPFCPESPKFTLHVAKDSERGKRDLKRLRNTSDRSKIGTERRAIEHEAAMMEVDRVSCFGLLRGSLRWPLVISVILMLLLQLSGISVAFYYSTIIFERVGFTGKDAAFTTIGIGIVNFLATALAIHLVNFSWCERRVLLLVGLVGMLTSTMAFVVFASLYRMKRNVNSSSQYFVVMCVFLLVFFFAIGPGSIPWYFVHELFEWNARGAACGVASVAYWSANFFVGSTFLLWHSVLEHYAYLIFVTFLAFFAYFVYVYVPETKGREVRDIYTELKRGKSIFKREMFIERVRDRDRDVLFDLSVKATTTTTTTATGTQ